MGLRPPHFECGALPVRATPPALLPRGRSLVPLSLLPRRPGGAFMLIGETGFEPATPASRTQCSTGLSYSPFLCHLLTQRRPTEPADGVGFEPTRAVHPTRFPIVLLKPLGHPSSLARRAGPARRPAQRRGWDSNPRAPFGRDGLANRCRDRLATSPYPTELPLLGSNQDSPDPESGVLPITPRGSVHNQSGRRGSNPRPSAWEADALPTELLPHGATGRT
jgi:hypothetical protein